MNTTKTVFSRSLPSARGVSEGTGLSIRDVHNQDEQTKGSWLRSEQTEDMKKLRPPIPVPSLRRTNDKINKTNPQQTIQLDECPSLPIAFSLSYPSESCHSGEVQNV